MESKHLMFELMRVLPKTRVFNVRSKSDKTSLGMIKWHPAWRQYCFFPMPDCVWSQSCLEDLTIFLQALKDERKKVKP